jgi:hypothetical protein
MDIRVAFIAFNRPHYLAKTIDLIKDQMQAFSDVHLFLDGSRVSKEVYTVRENARIFHQSFPEGTVHSMGANIGLDLNRIRLVNTMFGELQSTCCIWIEDDWADKHDETSQFESMINFCNQNGSLKHNCNISAWRNDTWQFLKPYLDRYAIICRQHMNDHKMFRSHIKEYAKNMDVHLDKSDFYEFCENIFKTKNRPA